MGIKFYCPNGHKMNVKSFLAGQKGRCPRCGVSVEIPLASTDKPPVPLPAPTSRPSGATRGAKPAPPFGMLVENPAPSAYGAGGPSADEPRVQTSSSFAPAPQPAPRSPGIPEIPAGRRWSSEPPEIGQDEGLEPFPGAAYVHTVRRRSKREKLARLSLIMMGIVAVLAAILIFMLIG